MGHKLGNPNDFPGLSVWPASNAAGYYTFERSLDAMIPWETFWSAGIWIEVNQVPDVFDYFLSTGAIGAADGDLNVYINPSSGKAVLNMAAHGGIQTGTVNLLNKGPLLVCVHRHGGTVNYNLIAYVLDLEGNELERLEYQPGGSGSEFDMLPIINIGRRGDGNTDRYFEAGKLGHFYLITHQSRYGESPDTAEAEDLKIAHDALRGVDLLDKYGEQVVCYLPLCGTYADLTGNGHNAIINHVSKPGIYMDPSVWLPPFYTGDDYVDSIIAALQSGGGGTHYDRILSEQIDMTDSDDNYKELVRSFLSNVDLYSFIDYEILGLVARYLDSSIDLYDELDRSVAYVRSIEQDLNLYDLSVKRFAFNRSLTANVELNDSIERAISQVIGRVLSSYTSISDDAVTRYAIKRALSQVVDLHDYIYTTFDINRALSSNVELNEQFTRSLVRILLRELVDQVDVTDSLLREIAGALVDVGFIQYLLDKASIEADLVKEPIVYEVVKGYSDIVVSIDLR